MNRLINYHQIAKSSYETFCRHFAWRQTDGQLYPQWEELENDEKAAWVAVVRHINIESTPPKPEDTSFRVGKIHVK